MAYREGTPAAAPGARGEPLPVVRDAVPGDTGPALAVYSACIAADPGYLPFLAPGDEPAVRAWFRLKPLLACLVAVLDGTVAGIAGLRDAEPGPGAGEAGGRWLEACRLAVRPACRGGAVTRDLTGARASRAAALGADRLWMRCVENSPSPPAGTVPRLDMVGTRRIRGTSRLPANRPAGPPAPVNAGSVLAARPVPCPAAPGP